MKNNRKSPSIVSRRMRLLMETKGLTVEELAAEAEVPVENIGSILSGDINVPAVTLEAIADTYEISTNYFNRTYGDDGPIDMLFAKIMLLPPESNNMILDFFKEASKRCQTPDEFVAAMENALLRADTTPEEHDIIRDLVKILCDEKQPDNACFS